MQPCDRLKLCLCQTSFLQPTAANGDAAVGSDLAPTDALPTGTTSADTALTGTTDMEDLPA